MAIPRERLSPRQKFCLVLSVLILLLGLLQVCLGILFFVQPRNKICHRVKYVLLGVYLIMAGICGLVSYVPRRVRNPCKTKRARGFRASNIVFIVFCILSSLAVILDNKALNCFSHNYESSLGRANILAFVEILAIHLAHILCVLCIGVAFPDCLSSRGNGWDHKCEKLLNSSTKHKSSKQALHLPEARTHIQEAAGTGDKVTVVSLPESDGIVYAVPEEQYVIRRGEATYMAPAGNTHLTAFFPTYNKVQID